MVKKGLKKKPVSIYLPEGLLKFMDNKVGCLYGSRSDYVADLIRKDMDAVKIHPSHKAN